MKKILLAALAACSVASANAATITFDPLEHAGTGVQELMLYTAEANFFLEGMPLVSVQQQHASYAGSASLHSAGGDSFTSLYKADLSAFTLNSIDLAPLTSGLSTGGTVTFTGKFMDGSTIEQSFEVGPAFAFSTFLFTGFTNLESVYWLQNYDFLHQYDNITVDEAQVPEPAPLAILGMGLIGMAASRRKRAKGSAIVVG